MCLRNLLYLFFNLLSLGYELHTITCWFSQKNKRLNDQSVLAFIRKRVKIPNNAKLLDCKGLPTSSSGQYINQIGIGNIMDALSANLVEHLPRLPFTGILVMMALFLLIPVIFCFNLLGALIYLGWCNAVWKKYACEKFATSVGPPVSTQ